MLEDIFKAMRDGVVFVSEKLTYKRGIVQVAASFVAIVVVFWVVVLSVLAVTKLPWPDTMQDNTNSCIENGGSFTAFDNGTTEWKCDLK